MNNNNIYLVFHAYDVDGGNGDAIGCKDLVAVFKEKEDAEKFIEKYSDPHVYDNPYDELWTGRLLLKEEELVTHELFDINNNHGFNAWD